MHIISAIKEVLFQFFLLKSGQFQSTEAPATPCPGISALTPIPVAFEQASWTDEWLEIEQATTDDFQQADIFD